MDRPEVFEYGNYGVNCKLTSMQTNKDVFWHRGNSFVVVDDPQRGGFLLGSQRVSLVSINGIGEIRWPVWSREVVQALQYAAEGKLDATWDCAMHLLAAKHFGLAVYLEA